MSVRLQYIDCDILSILNQPRWNFNPNPVESTESSSSSQWKTLNSPTAPMHPLRHGSSSLVSMFEMFLVKIEANYELLTQVGSG